MKIYARIQSSTIVIAACSLISCQTTKYSYSFLDEAHSGRLTEGEKLAGGIDFHQAPKITDTLAINYALSVANLLRDKYNGSRIARETSSTIQLALGALTSASSTLGFDATSISALGLGSTMIPGLQDIFKAKDRALVFQDAAHLITEAVTEFYIYNPAPSTTYITPNGVKVLQRVSGCIHLVEKTLAGQLPTPQEMEQSVVKMDQGGATPHAAGSAPVRHVTARGGEGDTAAGASGLTDEQVAAVGRSARFATKIELDEFQKKLEAAMSDRTDSARLVAEQWKTQIKIAQKLGAAAQVKVVEAVVSKATGLQPDGAFSNITDLNGVHDRIFLSNRGNPDVQMALLESLTNGILSSSE